jgi:hypothetical protein
VTEPGKITTRLRPDVDRRLRAAAALQRERISRIVNEAPGRGPSEPPRDRRHGRRGGGR